MAVEAHKKNFDCGGFASTIMEKYEKALLLIEDVTCNADEVQKRVLSEILTRNPNVEYLQRHGLNGATDTETFKKVIPVVTYEDLKPDIDRIANGDTSQILCSQPISEFLTSSGTSSGVVKLIPITEEELEKRSLLHNIFIPAVLNQFVPGLDKGKGMYISFIHSEAKTPGGLLARPASTSYHKNSHFKDMLNDGYTSPIETILCEDSYQSMYSQLLCGLYQNNDVLRIGANIATVLLRIIKFLEKHWMSLCNDIRNGSIDHKISDPSVREAVLKILKPNQKLADFIESECKKESWKGLISRLWPKAKCIVVCVTGTSSEYISTLDYYCNGLPLVGNRYFSSECPFGLNLKPLSKPSEVSYTLLPSVAYFEFLPVHATSPKLIDLVDVKLGEEYEVVVTTYTGLYRYRVGDILRVAGFKDKAPQFNFVCRKNVVLSVDCDKTDEVDLRNAVQAAANHLLPFDASLTEYTSYADISNFPGHYVIYWELRLSGATPIPPVVFEDCCLEIEESLSDVYQEIRVSDMSIGPLEIRIVETGTFDKLTDMALSRGASINQYKVPRCVKYAPFIEFLNSMVVSNHFSPKCPKWGPGKKQWSTQN